MKPSLILGALTLLTVATVPLPAGATPTENNSFRLLPAPAAVAIDGKTSDWDLSGGQFICDNVQTQRDTYAVWMHGMYDKDNLYLLARWTDETPLNNPGQTIADYGWNGDCLQVRFITNNGTPNRLQSVLNCWKGTDGHDVVQLDSPLTHKSPWGEDIKNRGAQQAFAVYPNGKGYVQEIAVPWKWLSKDGAPPPAGSALDLTFEPNFTVGIGGRMSIKDNFKAGTTLDRVFTFQNYPEWGPASVEPAGRVHPLPVRIADGREFNTRMEAAIPAVDWTGLIKVVETPGFKPISFTMPADGYVSLNIKNSSGAVVRQLLNSAFYTKGAHTIKWDGLPTPNLHLSGLPLPAGDYTWSALYNAGIGLKLRGWAHNSGQTPWDNGPKSNWGGDFGFPIAATSNSAGVYLGWMAAEAGKSVVATDLQGKVRWTNKHGGNGGVVGLAADEDALYCLEGPNIYKVAPTNGAYLPWGDKTDAILSLKGLWDGAPEAANTVTSKGGQVYLGYTAANKIALLDGKTGALVKVLDAAAPGQMWAKSPTELYVVSGGTGVLLVNPADGTSKKVLNGLTAASGITGDATGTLYLGLSGTTQQVQAYDANGKPGRSFGRAGGRVTRGPWVKESVMNPGSLALDTDGKLWVTEFSDFPKRISVWNPADGTLTKELFGPTIYGALGGNISPRDPSVMVGNGCEWRLDAQTGQASCLGVVTREGMGSARFATGPTGRTYLVVAPGWYVFGPTPFISIYERLGDANYKMRARFTFEGTGATATTKYWADANDDEIQQPEEVTTVPGVLQFNNWYPGITPDLTIYLGRDQYKVSGYTACGAPQYNLTAPAKLPASDPAIAQNTDEGLGSADAKMVLYNGNYLADRTTFRAFDLASGKMMWTYPNNFVGVHGSHNATGPEVGLIRGAYGIMGTAKLPAPIGNIWAIGTNVGEWHLLTGDGFYLTRLFEPDALKIHFPEQAVPGADMSETPPGLGGEDFGGSMTLADDGKVYVQAGKTAFWNLEVTGLDTVQAIPGGKVSLMAADVPRAQLIREGQLQGVQAKKLANAKMMTPAFSGVLAADFKGSDLLKYQKGDDALVTSAAAWDGENLYAAWEVADGTPWENGAKSADEMYTSGDTADLQLGTSATADRNRTEAGAGDLRLSIGNFGGKPTATLYRRVATNKKPKSFNSGVFKNYVMEYVGIVPDAKIVVTKRDKGYVVEAAIPLTALDFKAAANASLRADFGVTYGDPAGQKTRLRVYWSNQETGIVDDAVAELMMNPKNWGELKLMP